MDRWMDGRWNGQNGWSGLSPNAILHYLIYTFQIRTPACSFHSPWMIRSQRPAEAWGRVELARLRWERFCKWEKKEETDTRAGTRQKADHLVKTQRNGRRDGQSWSWIHSPDSSFSPDQDFVDENICPSNTRWYKTLPVSIDSHGLLDSEAGTFSSQLKETRTIEFYKSVLICLAWARDFQFSAK